MGGSDLNKGEEQTGNQSSWWGLSHLVDEANADIQERVEEITHLSDAKTNALSQQFQTLSKNASLQAKYLNDLIDIVQTVQNGTRSVSIQKISELLHKNFSESVRNLITDIQYQDRVSQDLHHIQRTVESMSTVNEGIRDLQSLSRPILVDIEALKAELPSGFSESIMEMTTKKSFFQGNEYPKLRF